MERWPRPIAHDRLAGRPPESLICGLLARSAPGLAGSLLTVVVFNGAVALVRLTRSRRGALSQRRQAAV